MTKRCFCYITITQFFSFESITFKCVKLVVSTSVKGPQASYLSAFVLMASSISTTYYVNQ